MDYFYIVPLRIFCIVINMKYYYFKYSALCKWKTILYFLQIISLRRWYRQQ